MAVALASRKTEDVAQIGEARASKNEYWTVLIQLLQAALKIETLRCLCPSQEIALAPMTQDLLCLIDSSLNPEAGPCWTSSS